MMCVHLRRGVRGEDSSRAVLPRQLLPEELCYDVLGRLLREAGWAVPRELILACLCAALALHALIWRAPHLPTLKNC